MTGRWRARRRDTGTLDDRAPGGAPIHSLTPEEIAAILEVVERWGAVDRSHRKRAHRGTYEQLVWVPPSTVRRSPGHLVGLGEVDNEEMPASRIVASFNSASRFPWRGGTP